MKTLNTKTWSGAEEVLGVKVIATESYIQVDEQSKINNQTIYLKKTSKRIANSTQRKQKKGNNNN